jgi:16S rRNA (uracil1498-N3)-methyltransferase
LARRRFFVERIEHQQASITGEHAQHLRRVLRVEPGQRFELCDNQAVYLAEVTGFRKDEVLFRMLEELPQTPPPVRIHLAAALVKFDRFEWLVEKATELGVARITPVLCERSDKGLEKAAGKRVERWRRIAWEASQQSRRSTLPEVRDWVEFSEAVGSIRSGVGRYSYFLDEMPAAVPLISAVPLLEQRSAADEVNVFVGPEGGWTGAERDAARDYGWTPVSLGPLILRAETAAAAALAIVSNAWEAARRVRQAMPG